MTRRGRATGNSALSRTYARQKSQEGIIAEDAEEPRIAEEKIKNVIASKHLGGGWNPRKLHLKGLAVALRSRKYANVRSCRCPVGCRSLPHQGLQALLLLAGDRDRLWRTTPSHFIRMPGFAIY
jgi:hypothetical protein